MRKLRESKSSRKTQGAEVGVSLEPEFRTTALMFAQTLGPNDFISGPKLRARFRHLSGDVMALAPCQAMRLSEAEGDQWTALLLNWRRFRLAREAAGSGMSAPFPIDRSGPHRQGFSDTSVECQVRAFEGAVRGELWQIVLLPPLSPAGTK